MAVKKSAVTYKVLYRGKPGFEDIGEGCHANLCLTMKEAEEAVAGCKKWFNNEIVKEPICNKDGKQVTPAVIEFRNNVYVWIDTYIDGQLAESGEEKACAESSEATEPKQPTGSTASKSVKPSSSEPSQTSRLETAAAS